MPERQLTGPGEAAGVARPGPGVVCPIADGGLGDFCRLRAAMELGRKRLFKGERGPCSQRRTAATECLKDSEPVTPGRVPWSACEQREPPRPSKGSCRQETQDQDSLAEKHP